MFEEEGFSEDETEEFSCFPQKSADLNYETAGTEVIVPESGVDLVSHHHLLTDKVHAVLLLPVNRYYLRVLKAKHIDLFQA